MPARAHLSRGTYGTIEIVGGGVVNVGKYCSLAPYIRAIMNGHRTEWVSTYPFTHFNIGLPPEEPTAAKAYGAITVGNDVWIGTAAILLGGVTIGDGAVVGAGAVVTNDVKPYSVVVGSPARLAHYRFTDLQIMRLLRLKWWDWPEEKIAAAAPDLQQSDVDRFLDKWEGSSDGKIR